MPSPIPLRVFVGGISQETNSFSPLPSTLQCFERGYLLAGSEVVSTLSDTNTEMAGFLSRLGAEGEAVKVLPGFTAWSVAGGPLTADAYRILANRLRDSLKALRPVDGVLLILHGSLASTRSEDCEGDILKLIRETVGESVPIVCALDYHAMVTKTALKHADILVGYRTYPHVDMAETGARAAECLLRLIRDGPDIDTICARVPMILPVDNTETGRGPMAEVLDDLLDWEKHGTDVISASLFCTHPWVDAFDHGVAMLIYAHSGHRRDWEDRARSTGERLWVRRAEFFPPLEEAGEILASLSTYEKPLILIDGGDITSAGAPGDSTTILRALLEQPEAPRSILPIVDPQTVETAFAAGEGAVIACAPGGCDAPGRYNTRIPLRARVEAASGATVTVQGTSFSGLRIDAGRRARLSVNNRIDLIVTEYTSLMHDPQFISTMGANPATFEVIVQKSHKLFRAGYRDIAKSVATAATPGCTDPRIARLPFNKVRRPIYPLDAVVEFPGYFVVP